VFGYPSRIEQGRCIICGQSSSLISKALEICSTCIRKKPEIALARARKVHGESRTRFGLPPEVPKDTSGVRCRLCANECSIPKGGLGYCGLRKNVSGKLVHLAGTPDKGIVQCYYDPLPTNCVAIEFCAGGSGAGYPRYAHSKGAEYGYKNLAVFYGACSFNCLYCQNWHYRELTRSLSPIMAAKELAGWVDDKTSCVCFFGGDPSPQMPHALEASRIAIEKAKGILRICWESNGSMAPSLMEKAAALSLESGGTIKFDLKAWDENIHFALCGVSNKQTFRNFKWLAEYGKQRQVPPLLTASTLLIPGYVDAEEVESIASFIAGLDPDIPYSLLAFYPQFYMNDMPTTSRKGAMECMKVARKYLKRVRIGNAHLLS
jgi:pyruvate formate lyase activating enzyme